MELTIAEQIMYSTLQIVTFDSAFRASQMASGFIMHFCENKEAETSVPALVTNRHVLEGANLIQVFFTAATPDGKPDNSKTIPAYISISNAIPHPNSDIDLAIIPILPVVATLKKQGNNVFYIGLSTDFIPTPEEWKNLDAIEEVIMVGYPKGLRDTANNLPIFRRGITATHPAYDYKGSPDFLIDMACYPGSSGSPVFILTEGQHYDKRNRKLNLGTGRFMFLGIQRAVPNLSQFGDLITIPSEETVTIPRMQSFINLGIIVKSTQLEIFDSIIKIKIGTQSSR